MDYKKTGKCRLSLAKERFYKTNNAFVLRKNSPLRNIFNQKYILLAIQ